MGSLYRGESQLNVSSINHQLLSQHQATIKANLFITWKFHCDGLTVPLGTKVLIPQVLYHLVYNLNLILLMFFVADKTLSSSGKCHFECTNNLSQKSWNPTWKDFGNNHIWRNSNSSLPAECARRKVASRSELWTFKLANCHLYGKQHKAPILRWPSSSLPSTAV